MRVLLILFSAVIFGILAAFYLSFVNYVDATEIGVAWNYVKGEAQIQPRGWNFSPPWVLVARVDARPIRVCITSTTRGGLNCKLVQFEPAEFRSFLTTEGFSYYWWRNRLSFNSGYKEEYRGMKDVMRGYAYGSKRYPFVTILREYEVGE